MGSGRELLVLEGPQRSPGDLVKMQILGQQGRAGPWVSVLQSSQVMLILSVQGPQWVTREISGVDASDQTPLNS